MEVYNRIDLMAMEDWRIQMGLFIKENSNKELERDKDLFISTLMALTTRGKYQRVEPVVMEYLYIKMKN